jgi:hypothetical protein
MKTSDLFPKPWAERQAERDRDADARATAPTRDSRTGELVPHCTGRRHQWNGLRSPRALVCDRCGAVKLRDR